MKMVDSVELTHSYGLQHRKIQAAEVTGRQVCGYKVALTALAQQVIFGVPEPVYGRIFTDHLAGKDCEVAADSGDALAIEVEQLLTFNTDLENEFRNVQEFLGAIEESSIAIEVIRIPRAPTKPDVLQLVENNGFIERVAVLESLSPAPDIADHLRVEVNSEMRARFDVRPLGAHLETMNWLIRSLSAAGFRVERGQTILTGAMHDMIFLQPGQQARVALNGAEIGGVARPA